MSGVRVVGWFMRRISLLFTLVLGLGLSSACGKSNLAEPADLAPATSAPAGVSTIPPTPSPSPATSTHYPSGTLSGTGNVGLDSTIRAATGTDLTALAASIRTVAAPCVSNVIQAGTALRCPSGAPERSPVQVFSIEQCVGGYFAPADERTAAVRGLIEIDFDLFAVIELPADLPIFKFSDERGGYVVFLSSSASPPGGVTLRTGRDGAILSIGWGCGQTPVARLAGWSTTGRLVLPPSPGD